MPGKLWALVRQLSAWLGKALTNGLLPESCLVLDLVVPRIYRDLKGFGWFWMVLDQFLDLMGGGLWTPSILVH